MNPTETGACWTPDETLSKFLRDLTGLKTLDEYDAIDEQIAAIDGDEK